MVDETRVWIWADRSRRIKFHGRLDLFTAKTLHEYISTPDAVVRPVFPGGVYTDSPTEAVSTATTSDFSRLQVRVLFDIMTTEIDGNATSNCSACQRGVFFDRNEDKACHVDVIDESHRVDLAPGLSAKYPQDAAGKSYWTELTPAHSDSYPHTTAQTHRSWKRGCSMIVPLKWPGAHKHDLLHVCQLGCTDTAMLGMLSGFAMYNPLFYVGDNGVDDNCWLHEACVSAWASRPICVSHPTSTCPPMHSQARDRRGPAVRPPALRSPRPRRPGTALAPPQVYRERMPHSTDFVPAASSTMSARTRGLHGQGENPFVL